MSRNLREDESGKLDALLTIVNPYEAAIPAFSVEGFVFLGHYMDACKEYIIQNPSNKFIVWLQDNYTVFMKETANTEEEDDRTFFEKWDAVEPEYSNLDSFTSFLMQAYRKASDTDRKKLEDAYPQYFLSANVETVTTRLNHEELNDIISLVMHKLANLVDVASHVDKKAEISSLRSLLEKLEKLEKIEISKMVQSGDHFFLTK